MLRKVEAFLDIEATGLSLAYCEITVVGNRISHGSDTSSTQLEGVQII